MLPTHPPANTVCQILSNTLKHCQILSNTVKYCLSNTVKYSETLSNTVKYCQILSRSGMGARARARARARVRARARARAHVRVRMCACACAGACVGACACARSFQTTPRQLPDSSQTAPRQLPDSSQTGHWLITSARQCKDRSDWMSQTHSFHVIPLSVCAQVVCSLGWKCLCKALVSLSSCPASTVPRRTQ